MGEVIDLPCITRLDLPPDKVLQKAMGELKNVVIAGFTKDGDEYFSSSVADGGAVLWLIERLKKQLLEVPELFDA